MTQENFSSAFNIVYLNRQNKSKRLAGPKNIPIKSSIFSGDGQMGIASDNQPIVKEHGFEFCISQ